MFGCAQFEKLSIVSESEELRDCHIVTNAENTRKLGDADRGCDSGGFRETGFATKRVISETTQELESFTTAKSGSTKTRSA